MLMLGKTKHKTLTSPFRTPQGLGGGRRLWAAAHVYKVME